MNATNLETMLQQLAGAFNAIPFTRLLGLQLDHLDNTQVSMSFHMKEELIGNFLHKILHGGVISSVLDMAGGMVIMAATIHAHPECNTETLAEIIGKCSTIDLHINYLSPGKGHHFIAKASLLKQGKKIGFTQMSLHNQDESLIATGSGTYTLS